MRTRAPHVRVFSEEQGRKERRIEGERGMGRGVCEKVKPNEVQQGTDGHQLLKTIFQILPISLHRVQCVPKEHFLFPTQVFKQTKFFSFFSLR